MSHACPIGGCSINVPSHMFMCARHWRMVPKPLQLAVYESYRREGRISDNHREAVRVVDQAESGRVATGLPAGTKALTMWQPWASLVMIGAKPFEFRNWCFTDKPHLASLVGREVVLHAGARQMRVSEISDILERIATGSSALIPQVATPFLERCREALRRKEPSEAPLSSALGTVIFERPRKVADLFQLRNEVADSSRLSGGYGWPVRKFKPFSKPIPSAGAQGFWNWS